jgi:addiction module RelB/DinJ family antitoxin
VNPSPATHINNPVKYILIDKETTLYILCSMSTVISVRTDKNIKKAAAQVARSAGITLSSLINSYLRQVVATRRIELYAPEPMTPRLESLVAEVEAELANGKVSKKFSNADDFLTDLKK